MAVGDIGWIPFPLRHGAQSQLPYLIQRSACWVRRQQVSNEEVPRFGALGMCTYFKYLPTLMVSCIYIT